MLSRQPCQLDFRPRRCGDASPYSCVTSPHFLLYFSLRLLQEHHPPPGVRLRVPHRQAGGSSPAALEESVQTQLVCRIFGVECAFLEFPHDHAPVGLVLTTTVYLCFLTPTGRDQATLSRGRLYRKRKYCYFLVRSPGLCIFRLHVIEVGRTVSLRDEGLPLTIFPDFPTFEYIFVVRYCIGPTCIGYGRTAGYLFS